MTSVPARTRGFGALLELPIVGAPMAGGPSTPALAAAVSNAGGIGFVGAGYRDVDEVARELAEVGAATTRPFGVNLFVPTEDDAAEREIASYAERLEAEAQRYGVALGEPRWSDDAWEAKLELVGRVRPAVVSFTFGCPSRELVESLRSTGVAVWCTVTSPDEATTASAAGADALVVQGAEAGGHNGSYRDDETEPVALLPLLQLVRRVTEAPLVAAGGIATGRAVAAVLAAGASAAQVGTALMLAPEAGTSEAHRRALQGTAATAFTRAFTGRRARGIVNGFMRAHGPVAPRAYPQVHALTAPVRAAARAADDADGLNLWAGQAYRLARAAPAADLVTEWAAEAEAIRRAT